MDAAQDGVPHGNPESSAMATPESAATMTKLPHHVMSVSQSLSRMGRDALPAPATLPDLASQARAAIVSYHAIAPVSAMPVREVT
jgi:hypothetical protein